VSAKADTRPTASEPRIYSPEHEEQTEKAASEWATQRPIRPSFWEGA